MDFIRFIVRSVRGSHFNPCKNRNRRSELKSCHSDTDSRGSCYGVAYGFRDTFPERNHRNRKEKLDFPDSFRACDWSVLALLLQGSSNRRSVKSRSCRQDERRDNPDSRFHLPSRKIHSKIGFRLHPDRSGNSDYGALKQD